MPSACPAFFSAGPATLGITHPITPLGPAALSAAPACLGITYPCPTIPPGRLHPSTEAMISKYFPWRSAPTPTTPPTTTIPPITMIPPDPPTHDPTAQPVYLSAAALQDPQVTLSTICASARLHHLHIPRILKLNRASLVQAYLEAVAAKSSRNYDPTQPSASVSQWLDTCKHCKDPILTCSCHTGFFVTGQHQPHNPTEAQLDELSYFINSTLLAEETAME